MSSPSPLPLREFLRHADSPADLERLLSDCYRRAEAAPEAWIHRVPFDTALAAFARASERKSRGEALPLYGVPFAVKDNIDVAGMPTTAACPAYEYTAAASSPVVERLLQAGAIVFGKTNLDQFATGLSGVRSPYGICKNPFDPRYISGGSSSGSGLLVAIGACAFSLGTDTAGSGRVPAALTNIVGLKPSRGLLSTRHMVPACRSLDCLSIFAASAQDARTLFESCREFDALDPLSRQLTLRAPLEPGQSLRLGIPREEELEFYGDSEAARLFRAAVARFEALGATIQRVAYAPFQNVARLLYDGPWVAERLVAAGELLRREPSALHPVLRGILQSAETKSALEAFQGQYRLAELRREVDTEWQRIDALLLPTTPTTWTIEAMLADPVELNSKLGYYTNFVNLLDLCGLAVPAGFRGDGLPLGVTLLAPAGFDAFLLELGCRYTAR